MMNLKTVVATLALCSTLGFSASALAHPKEPVNLDPILDELNLDSSRETELRSLFDEMHESREEKRKVREANRKEFRDEMRTARSEHKEKVQALLSEEEADKFHEYMKSQRPAKRCDKSRRMGEREE